MNLLTDSTGLTVEKLDVLKHRKIFTTLDFVQANNDKLSSWIGCNVSEIIKIKEKILASNNSKPMRADKLCDIRLHTTVFIESGIEKYSWSNKLLGYHELLIQLLFGNRIDNLLGGGIQSGRITEIYGDSGSGKTHLALQLSANASLKQQHTVSYLTSGEINCQKILKIMEGLDKVNENKKHITYSLRILNPLKNRTGWRFQWESRKNYIHSPQ